MEVHHLIHTEEKNGQQLNARNVVMEVEEIMVAKEDMAIKEDMVEVIRKRNMVVAFNLFHFQLVSTIIFSLRSETFYCFYFRYPFASISFCTSIWNSTANVSYFHLIHP